MKLLLMLWAGLAFAQGTQPTELKTGRNHPMQYYLSLPEGWNANQKWPILVTVEGSGRNWLGNAKAFADARKHMPFIIITALALTNSGHATQSRYSYPKSVWDVVGDDPDEKFKFDHEGIVSTVKEVAAEYSGKEKFFITGFSGGGHTTWSIIFAIPEKLAGAALAAANYDGRGVDQFSKNKARAKLPIRGFQGDQDAGIMVLTRHWALAKKEAESHGYKNLTYEKITGMKHNAFPAQVMAWFASLPN